ncbi:MAG: biopolymer transport protein ExbD [Pirellulaceae bacterium]|jgi:biopolymer transport protein ExbD
MRVPDRHHNSGGEFNMTPMIDVVFLLIIFFLVSSHLAKQESQMELPLPAADSGTLPDEQQANPRITVNVLNDGALMLSGRTITAVELQQILVAKKTTDGPDLEVRIRGDRQAGYRFVEPIMLSCARAGIWNVTFAVYRTEDVIR